jgi:4-hydroxy-tetrahydrodipicolinate reductase
LSGAATTGRRIGVLGAAGRMGQMLVRQIAETDGAVLAAACDRPGHAAIGRDAGQLAGLETLGIAIGADPAALFQASEVVIDFTSPDATASYADLAAKSGTALVIGTTGLKPEHIAAIDRAAHKIVIVQAANFSAGVTLLTALTEQVARTLGPVYDIEILEMHHRHKVDAPSGTALALGAAAAKGRGLALEQSAIRGRDGITGERAIGPIGFAALRGGDVAGDHSVIFAGPGERLELVHKASGRQVFAAGAVQAALWTAGKPAGRYDMRAVLGL